MNYSHNRLFGFATSSLFLLLVACSSCKSPNPGMKRPEVPVCFTSEDGADCTGAAGDFHVDHKDIIATTLDGYSAGEKYVDGLEKENLLLRQHCR